MSKLTFAKVEAAIAACVILGFCVISFLGAIILVFVGTRIYISYACASILVSTDSTEPSLANRTCEFLTDPQTDSSEILGYVLMRDSDPIGAIMTLMTCWMILILVVSINIPQASAAWDLLWATTLTKKTNKRATELSLIWTWQHQSLQNIIIIVELLITVLFTLIILVLPDNNNGVQEQLEWIVGIMVKVLTGRVFCAFFVEIYFHEQLLAICFAGRALVDLSLPPRMTMSLAKKTKLQAKEDTNTNASVPTPKKPEQV